jgi:hypothetical protein
MITCREASDIVLLMKYLFLFILRGFSIALGVAGECGA